MSRFPPCPDATTLGQLARGIGDEETLVEFGRHLDSCDTCSETFDAIIEDSDSCVRELSQMPARTEDEAEYQRLVQDLLSRPEPFGTTLADDRSHPALIPIDLPFRIAEYELVELLGRGAHGSVYKARHRKLERWVAVKLLAKRSTAEGNSRFLDEMRAIGRLDHPNIIRATDAGESRDWFYLVMEYQPGTDVSFLVRKMQRLPIADACEIARQVAAGLSCVATHGLVHRDIKPSNLLLTKEGDVKLLDLGLAAFSTAENDLQIVEQPPRGTADYMSPEQWSDYAHVDIRADLYSLGCTLYKMLVGYAPFQSVINANVRRVGLQSEPTTPHSSPNNKRYSHRNLKPTSLRAIRPEVPESLDRIVSRLLAKSPQDRLSSPLEVEQLLQPYCKSSGLKALASASDPATLGFRDPDLERKRQMTRRVLLGSLVATASAVGLSRWDWKTTQGGLQYDRWRPLDVKYPHALLASIQPEYPRRWDWTGLQSKDRNFSLQPSSSFAAGRSVAKPRLLNLGQPVIGQFRFRVAMIQSEWKGQCGVFFKFEGGEDVDEKSKRFQSIEWLLEDAQPRLHWSQVHVDDAFRIHRTPLAGIDVPIDRGEEHVLEVHLGTAGFPVVSWDSTILHPSTWSVSFDGRQQSAIPKRRLQTEYRGRIGLIAQSASVRFHNPELCYLR